VNKEQTPQHITLASLKENISLKNKSLQLKIPVQSRSLNQLKQPRNLKKNATNTEIHKKEKQESKKTKLDTCSAIISALRKMK
jgi:hypothetical protein